MNLFEDFESASLLEGAGLKYGQHSIRLASNTSERAQAQKLRYQIFNEELGEGIPENAATGMDVDEFDERCDHLLIYRDQDLIGTNRLLPGQRAKAHEFYTQTEFHIENLGFDFQSAVELGRVCIHEEHRRRTTLMLLFWALQNYMTLKRARYLFGCSSFPKMSLDDAEATFELLCEQGVVDYTPGVAPHEKNSFRGDVSKGHPQVPQLLKVYLDFGARIVGRPAYDAVFGCCDVLTVLDTTKIKGRGLNLISKFHSRSANGAGSL